MRGELKETAVSTVESRVNRPLLSFKRQEKRHYPSTTQRAVGMELARLD